MSYLVLDTETTGVDRAARILELAILSGDAVHSWRFNPGMPIPAEATAVHGITDADVADCATFAEQADDVLSHLNGYDAIVGFNVRFDLDMLQAELAHAGREPLDLTRKTLVCAMRYWQHHEPRTLSAAVEKFCWRPHAGAHGAAADVQATRDVLEAMRLKFGGLLDVADPMPERHTWCGPSHHLRWQDGVVVFGVGKHEGKPVTSVPRDYLDWVIRADFPAHVKDACRVAIVRPAEFTERCRKRFAAEAT